VDLDGGAPREIRFVARVEFLRDRTPLPPVRVLEPGSEHPARGLRGLGLSPDGKSIALIALEKLWVFEPGLGLLLMSLWTPPASLGLRTEKKLPGVPVQ